MKTHFTEVRNTKSKYFLKNLKNFQNHKNGSDAIG